MVKVKVNPKVKVQPKVVVGVTKKEAKPPSVEPATEKPDNAHTEQVYNIAYKDYLVAFQRKQIVLYRCYPATADKQLRREILGYFTGMSSMLKKMRTDMLTRTSQISNEFDTLASAITKLEELNAEVITAAEHLWKKMQEKMDEVQGLPDKVRTKQEDMEDRAGA